MSLARIRARLPSAELLGLYQLSHHQLCFHKHGDDSSGKCDAFLTHRPSDKIFGALYQISFEEKVILDKIEGVGVGYDIREVLVTNYQGAEQAAYMYYATKIKNELKPYSWYLNHVLVGAQEIGVPQEYYQQLLSISAIDDPDRNRERQEFSVHK